MAPCWWRSSCATSLRPALYVVTAIPRFLDPSGEMTLARACSLGSLRLLDHIWASSCITAEDRAPGWSRFNWLRSDPVYYQWQFEESVQEAARAGHLDAIRWPFAHFEGCSMSKAAAEEATRNGHYDVLPLLLSLDLRSNHVALPEGLENRGNEVEWGRRRHAERREERPGRHRPLAVPRSHQAGTPATARPAPRKLR